MGAVLDGCLVDSSYNYHAVKSRMQRHDGNRRRGRAFAAGRPATTLVGLPNLACRALLPPMVNSLQISAARCAEMPLRRSARADRIGALMDMIEQTVATSSGNP